MVTSPSTLALNLSEITFTPPSIHPFILVVVVSSAHQRMNPHLQPTLFSSSVFRVKELQDNEGVRRNLPLDQLINRESSSLGFVSEKLPINLSIDFRALPLIPIGTQNKNPI